MTENTSMIDRVARAMKKADDGDYRTLARIAIDTMREPTEAMHDAGSEIVTNQNNDPTRPLPTLRNAYKAMIDAALEGWSNGDN